MKKILFVCGEPSGADYVNDILAELRQKYPDARLAAVGDSDNPVEGVEYLMHYRIFTHFAWISVIFSYFRIYAAGKRILRWCVKNRPDLVVLVDSPGLNLRLAERLRGKCRAVYYFISPHIWLWKKQRVEVIKKFVDVMHPVLPFELEHYRREKVPAVLVQHPKLAKIERHEGKPSPELREFVDEAGEIVGLLPGSRRSEIRRFIPLLIDTALQMLEGNCRLRFIMPIRSSALSRSQRAAIKSKLGRTLLLVEDDFYSALKSCDYCLCASGTACLEVAMMRVPMVVYYKMGFLDTLIFRLFVKAKYVSLVNILLNSQVVAECLGDAANPDTICAEMELLFRRRGHYHTQLDKFERLHNMLKVDTTMAGAIGSYIDGTETLEREARAERLRHQDDEQTQTQTRTTRQRRG